jgi:hypothetical protein
MSSHTGSRPPGWREAIAAALRDAPEATTALAESVAGLISPALTEHLTNE